MKNLLHSLLLILISGAYAQLPEKPEDISPLLIGEKFPEVSIQTIDGKLVTTTSLFGKGKTILIFYRGGWCPYCNTHLSEVGQIESDLRKLGYEILAVSPDAPENLKKSIEKNKLSYTLLSDKDGLFARTAGIAFKAPTH